MKKKALGIFTAMAIIISFCIPVSATNDIDPANIDGVSNIPAP